MGFSWNNGQIIGLLDSVKGSSRYNVFVIIVPAIKNISENVNLGSNPVKEQLEPIIPVAVAANQYKPNEQIRSQLPNSANSYYVNNSNLNRNDATVFGAVKGRRKYHSAYNSPSSFNIFGTMPVNSAVPSYNSANQSPFRTRLWWTSGFCP